jgi:succinate-semialdehyde dehydrogenase/glutarate-semialdehyde dehydrogenase
MTQAELTAPSATALDPSGVLADVPRDLFLAGEWKPGSGGRRMPVMNPATGKVLAEVADADEDDARAAVQAAQLAQRSWARAPARVRSEILYRAYELMVERTEQLALVMTLEMGKPLAEARGEVAYAAEFFRWFAEEAVRIDGGYSHRPDGAARNLQVKQPVGPCLLIIPWNFPLAMGARKLGPAIAAGCVSILKPAPQTPLSSLALAQILVEAGLPEGVLSVLPTSRSAELVQLIFDSGVIRKLSFTGSTAVGKHLLAQAADGVLRTSMELGGNAPFLVLEDADIERAVEAAVSAKMRNMGEACTAANRFYVHAAVADQFASRLAQRMGSLSVGDGTEQGVDVGPLIDEPSRQKVRTLIQDAVQRGATVLVGGGCPDQPGYFVEPTVLINTHPDSALASAEIFGPVAAIQTFTDLDEVIDRANDTDWGLVGYVITQDIDRALNVAERLEVGMVGINTGVVSTPSAPFGGVKHSGLGREGGRVGIDEFLETKYISIPVRTDVP